MSTEVNPRKDHYKALGVSPSASAEEIKKAYRRLAKQFHPDSTGGDKTKEARFKEVSSAYDVLGDADRRARYDALRTQGTSARAAPFESAMGGAWDLSDLFASAGWAPRTHVRVESFDSEDGAPWRRGAAERAAPPATVRASDGTPLTVSGLDVASEVRVPFDRAILGTVVTVATLESRAQVRIPPGSSSGKRLRLRGKGRSEHGRRGDHYLTIHIDVPSDLDDDEKKQLVELSTRLRKRGRLE
ncbi:MAG: DnaJ domain-containing protein [Kofleriaceae bacterium]